jgi:tRNA U34 5-methylaminomethyl-2-thiouridine-forming methyltransferase MnmC
LSEIVVPEGQSADQAEADVVRRAQEAMSASVAA